MIDFFYFLTDVFYYFKELFFFRILNALRKTAFNTRFSVNKIKKKFKKSLIEEKHFLLFLNK
jgi:hypothetical protein